MQYTYWLQKKHLIIIKFDIMEDDGNMSPR